MKTHITTITLWMLVCLLQAQDNNGRYYSAGEIQSKQEVLYGRFEMMMYSSDMSGTTSTFFMWREGGQQNNMKWNELDIETFGKDHTMWQSNPIWQIDGDFNTIRRWEGFHRAIPIANTWVKFTLEWTPDYIAWYNNDVEVRRILKGQNAPQGNDPVGNISNAMRMCFNHWATFPGDWLGPFNAADLPSFQFVDWFTYQPWTGTGFGPVSVRHDFNTLAEVTTAYNVSTHTFDDNQCTFRAPNVGVTNGMLWLSVTGYNNARPPAGNEIPNTPGGGIDPPIVYNHLLPKKVEAEEFNEQDGLQLETTTDADGGQNLAHTDAGDYADYTIEVTRAGSYAVDFRVASLTGGAGFSIAVDDVVLINEVDIAATGDWQNWVNVTDEITLLEGEHTLRLTITKAGVNINWMEFTYIPVLHHIPGKIEAEDFSNQFGLETEITTDLEGGQNLGLTTVDDYAEYTIDVTESNTYQVDFRVASLNGDAGLSLQLDDNTVITDLPIETTGGWQDWVTISQEIALTAGQHTLRFNVLRAGFNINWIAITPATVTGTDEIVDRSLTIYPNPVTDIIHLSNETDWELVNASGTSLMSGTGKTINTTELSQGLYIIKANGGAYKVLVK